MSGRSSGPDRKRRQEAPPQVNAAGGAAHAGRSRAPKMLCALYRAVTAIATNNYPRHSGCTDTERAAAAALNRLLCTEAVACEAAAPQARRAAERRESLAQKMRKGTAPGGRAVGRWPPALPQRRPVNVRRTLRSQLMGILGAPSADAAATLVTEEGGDRARSMDRGRRMDALLPEGVGHAYRVVPEEEEEREGEGRRHVHGGAQRGEKGNEDAGFARRGDAGARVSW